ncbi:MAG: hypothetical protein J6B89_03020 [Bacilli bacterium]|nr:hypothetical protein [Bacilli bacterium]
MNQGTITLDYGRAKSDAEEIKNIAAKVSSIFDDTNAEIQKLQQNWTSTSSQSSVQSAIDTYNQYKANFERFLEDIKNQAINIETACNSYLSTEGSTNQSFDSATRIQ